MNWLIEFFTGAFGRKPDPQPFRPTSAEEYKAQQAALEAHIEAAGRDEVFAHARALGWTGGAPMWVWHAIASEVQSRKMAQNSPKSPQSG